MMQRQQTNRSDGSNSLMNKAPLEDVLSYRFNDLTDAFQESFNLSEEETMDVFQELLKFLWLSEPGTTKYTSLCIIEPGMSIIDEMWHLFLQFTAEYQQFCNAYFGRFLHHSPTTVAEKKRAKSGLSESEFTRRKAAAKTRYETIYELLGRETFIKWFHQFPSRYPVDSIRDIRRK